MKKKQKMENEKVVGEIFLFENVRLKVVLGDDCDCCYFYEPRRCTGHAQSRGPCHEMFRTDGKSVKFIRMDKIEKNEKSD